MSSSSSSGITSIRSTHSHNTVQQKEAPAPTQMKNVANISFVAREAPPIDLVKTTKKMNNYANGNVKKIQRAESLFDKLLQNNQTPNTVTCNTRIKSYVNSGQLEKAFETLQFMRDNNINPDLITYNTLILGCESDQAFEIYDRIVRDNLEPDVYTYTNLINACARTKNGNRTPEALKLLKSSKIKPTVVTFNSIIKDLFNLQYDEAMQADDEAMRAIKEAVRAVVVAMEQEGIEPDAWTYGTIMQGYLSMKKYAQVIDIYHSMKNPDSFHVKTAMDAYVQQELYQEAIVFFEEQTAKIPADNKLYSFVIRTFVKIGEMQRALKVLDMAEESPKKPDSYCYYPILMACTVERASLAYHLFLAMKNSGIRVDITATNKVIQVCTLAKMDKEASDAREYLLHLNRAQANRASNTHSSLKKET